MADQQARSLVLLSEGWEFKQTARAQDEWLPVSQFPTNVHLDLMKHDKIPDPFLEKNELLTQWVGEKSWSYRTTFRTPALSRDGGDRKRSTTLVFDGLDTFATVFLNDTEILKSENMFLPHRVDVTQYLRRSTTTTSDGDDGINRLVIHFDSALLKAREIQKEYPKHKWLCWNGEPARLAVRKAQYHWGWDWGPILVTCGPWKPVWLEVFEGRISGLWADVSVDTDGSRASVKVGSKVELVGESAAAAMGSCKVKFCLEFEEGRLQEAIVDVKEGCSGSETSGNIMSTSPAEFDIENPSLWFPHGYGQQHLYTISATLIINNFEVHTEIKRVGLRRAEVIQEKDKHGQSFYFRINGVDIFCGGSNWIPADSFLPRISEKNYRDWLKLMVDGNQVMIRVWAGGIYEQDTFYNLCDELGILVWQDFPFACGNYPTFPSLLRSIEAEAVSNVRRLRHHPSLVIYAGNNEDYQIQESNGLTYDYDDKDPESWLKTDFPARYIYEKLLPEVVAREAPGVFYHPGSPWGGGRKTTDPTIGDIHQWNVWHGTQEKYQIYDSLGGRFNSEFGMEAFPHIQTIKSYLPPGTIPNISSIVDFHNKAAGQERRIATYMFENFRTVSGFEAFIHLSQTVQSQALKSAFRDWRHQWSSPSSRRCGGALVWQLNDCWPVTSWSIADHKLLKKPSYYTIARALAPLAIGIKRTHWDWSVTPNNGPPESVEFTTWVSSSKGELEGTVRVDVRFVSIQTGLDIKPSVVISDLKILPNGATEVYKSHINNLTEEPHILAARLWINGTVVSRDVDWPQPIKYLEFKDRGVRVSFKGSGEIVVSAEKPVLGLVFEEREGVRMKDGAVDVVPGDEIVLGVEGLGEGRLGWRYVGMEE